MVFSCLSCLTILSVGATQDRTSYFNKNYTLTGNPIDDIVAVAQAQANRTKAQMGYTEAWCANFVGDCASLAGLGDIIPRNGYCGTLYSNILNAGGKEVTSPQKGDIIFYYCTASSCPNSGKPWVHVGIMTSPTSSIEGNSGGKVAVKSKVTYTDMNGHTYGHSGTNSVIAKYLRPNYPSREPVNNPIAAWDVAVGGHGNIRVTGWAYDLDEPNTSLDIHVYVGGSAGSGASCYPIKADVHRTDINIGNCNHGFDAYINVKEIGEQEVYVYAINVGEGKYTKLGPKTVTISGSNPIGKVDNIQGKAGGVSISGWAFDEDSPNESLDMHVYIGGAAGSGAKNFPIRADLESEDVNKAYNISGNHRYATFIETSLRGVQPIYVYAINKGAGDNTLIYKTEVEITNPGVALDFPQENQKVQEDTFLVQGWVRTAKDIEKIQCLINNEKTFDANLYTREDVPDATAFRRPIYTCFLANYENKLQITALFSDGTSEILETRKIYNDSAVLGHKVVVDEAVPPTLTETGLTEGKHCSVCGEVIVAQEVLQPIVAPTQTPTVDPTEYPTEAPTIAPTTEPTEKPTQLVTQAPTVEPTAQPTEKPTQQITQTPTVVPTKPPIKIGDADEDGIVNIFDATEIQLYLAKYKTLSDTQMIAADADKDGIVNIFDVTRIQLYLAKYITEL